MKKKREINDFLEKKMLQFFHLFNFQLLLLSMKNKINIYAFEANYRIIAVKMDHY
jgi:hypothetical protein